MLVHLVIVVSTVMSTPPAFPPSAPQELRPVRCGNRNLLHCSPETAGLRDPTELHEARASVQRVPTTCMHCAHRAPIRGQVRCCSDIELASWQSRRSGCSVWGESDASWECAHSKTFAEAEAICEGAGARLCTTAELEGGCTENTGCQFDHELVWGVPTPSPPPSPPESPLGPMPVECGKTGQCTTEAPDLRDPTELHEVRACNAS